MVIKKSIYRSALNIAHKMPTSHIDYRIITHKERAMKLLEKLCLITLVSLLGASTTTLATTPAAPSPAAKPFMQANNEAPDVVEETTEINHNEAVPAESEDNTAASEESSEEEQAAAEDTSAAPTVATSEKDDFVAIKVRGFELANTGNPTDASAAVDLFQKYLTAHPESSDAMIALSYAYMTEGKLKESFDLAEKGIKLDDKNYLGYYVLGLGYLGQGKGDLATQTLTNADKKAKEENNILGQMYASVGLSIVNLVTKHPEDCVKWADKTIKLAPAEVVAGKQIPASLEMDESNQSMLLTMYIAAVALKASVYIDGGKKTEGISLLENLSKAYPKDSRVTKALADMKKITQ
jgi:tetratricopeptide (TPR) repeat protein